MIRPRLVAVVGLVVMLVGAASPADDDPVLVAIRAIKSARRYLRSAPSDYEGHRTTAVAEATSALKELREAIAVGPGADR